MAQTRIGTKLSSGPASAMVELDFIDFNLSNPTTGAKPRLRQATVGYDAGNHTHITLGQTWDAFAPLNPFHRNYVGGSFTAGNLGFMRDQLIVTHKTKAAEFTGAAGFIGSNNSTSDGAIEANPVPTVSARAGLLLAEKKQIGAAGFYGQVPVSLDDKTIAWGANVFADLKLGKKAALRGEAYVGQNLAATGMLTLAQPVVDADTGNIHDIKETGGWLSMRQEWSSTWATTLTASGAVVLNPDEAAPNYTPVAGEVATLGSAPGMRQNLGARLGVEAAVTSHLLFYGEGFGFHTAYIIADGDNTAGMTPSRAGLELGGLFTF